MSSQSSKHYAIEIDCDNEQDAQEVRQTMQALSINGLPIWFVGHSAAQRVYAHTFPLNLNEALSVYAEADQRFRRVSIQSWVIDEDEI